MRASSRLGIGLSFVLVFAGFVTPGSARAANCGRNALPGGVLEIVGLTGDGQLLCLPADSPGNTDRIGFVTGLSTDVRLVGIDFRPATGDLWALGNAGGLYTIDLRNGAATLRSRLSTPLSGSNFGVDFNPTVDRLRIVSDDGQNLRVAVDTGAVTVDTPVSVTAPTTTTGIVGAAYTNNDGNPNTATTLFVLSAASDQIFIQAPPNAGSLNAVGGLVGDAGTGTGFDIYSDLRNGQTVQNFAYASYANGSRKGLFRINLLTGKGSLAGNFRPVDDIVDIAIPTRQ
jgi:hypothetical protein